MDYLWDMADEYGLNHYFVEWVMRDKNIVILQSTIIHHYAALLPFVQYVLADGHNLRSIKDQYDLPIYYKNGKLTRVG